ncbi:alpha-amylase family glycosyl hydrolase [Phaeovulum vinaykumarii]|uniref:Alpha-glucosidase n=1 Tax=Phaeovulum vinaykumarii TaxID=407234 RepID=A0A1N7LIN5_9RHOB|nr:alpha-amylase family glycosyl hydrolase [Phaeovulum vinaykumarii]SIS73611.1 alpha-glucosidase [Phaeovulum vinaykumarii]SOC04723.1 alpha-glucosidase [Phaeovulum vinaykumarii]
MTGRQPGQRIAFRPQAGDEWWRGAVIYQIYPRSFLDSNGDGIGDLPGITARLEHIADLGADAVWISPIFRSPMADMGYDVSDHCDVDPLFGTLEDFDTLIARAHDLGLRVILDQVLSHSSDQHPWFLDSRRGGAHANWYIWADARPDGSPPNNWQSVFGGSAWQWDAGRRQYYMHNFLAAQPDMNLHEPQVQEALLGAVRFWLERGVDGFRLDTVNYYFHDQALTDNPPARPVPGLRWPPVVPYDMQRHLHDKTRPENLAFLERLRALADAYGACLMGEVGETEGRALKIMGDYTAGNRRLHMAYSFDMLSPLCTPAHFRDTMAAFFAAAPDGWPAWSFSNHDVPRHVSRWAAMGAPEAVARQAIGLLVSLPGTIGIYQGEELGLPEAELAYSDLTDPVGLRFWPDDKGRDGARTPMPWDAAQLHGGFSTAKPWLPVTPPHLARAVSTQGPDGTLTAYRTALAFRRARPELRLGSFEALDLPDPVLGFRRDGLTCLFNLSAGTVTLDWPDAPVAQGPAQGWHWLDGQLRLDPNACLWC